MFFKKWKEKIVEEVEEAYDILKKDYRVKINPGSSEPSKVSKIRHTKRRIKWQAKNH